MIPNPARAPVLAGLLLLAGCQPSPPAAPGRVVAPAPAPAASTNPAAAAAAATPALKPAKPSLVVRTFDGGQFDLSAHRGKWVVVNYWATWCNPCLKEIPDLDAFDKSRADVETIGLAYEEIEPADMAAFLRQHPIGYPIAVLDVYKPPADFPVPQGLPVTYLIAPDGAVARQFLGPVGSTDLAAAIAGQGKTAASPAP
jgi:thiol-disulfide isomerase/thioredoxin